MATKVAPDDAYVQYVSSDDDGSAAGKGAASGSTMGQAKADMADLLQEVRALYAAEKEYVSGRFSFTFKKVQKISLLSGLLFILAICLLVNLTLGSLLILAHFFGPITATFAVTGVLILIITVLAIWTKKMLHDLKLKS